MDKRKAYEIAKKYTEFLRANKPGLKKVFLFGSYVKGNADDNSDIDMAVVFETFEDSFDVQVELMKMRRKFDTRIEPHPFRMVDFNSSDPFAKEVLTNGVEIYPFTGAA